MKGELVLTIEKDEESGWLVASWDDPEGGGITTQGCDLAELQANIKEAVLCHFEEDQKPDSLRLHFATDPYLSLA